MKINAPRSQIMYVLLAALGLSMTALAADPPASAESALAGARAKASADGKTVLVGFHASWCGWCKRMEKTLADPRLDAIMNRYFVVVWLDVLEADDKKNLENPGAEQVLQAQGGRSEGVPFFYFADAQGKTLINSLKPSAAGQPSGNIGCPYEADEIAHWLGMLKLAAPKITDEELATVKAGFEALKKSGGKG